ncbi:MAG: PKD domain-containing protein, partial [Thermoplasmata archaeon]|nr:PKD domain-containing protein [Thermoplasmata archaeon]
EAGDDVTVDEGRTVTLDASASVDNVGIDWYYWDLTYDGQRVSIQHGLPDYQFTFEIPGVYNITLRVKDARGNEGADQLVVTVLDITPPVAEAGENMVIDQHTTVTFNSPLSSDNVAIVEFNWTFEYDGEEQVLSGTGPEFTFDLPGVYNVTLRVSDAAGHTASDTLIITVVDITPPVAVAGEDVLMEVDGTLTFNGTGSTDDVAIASITWTFEYEGRTQTLTGATPEFTFHQVGEYAVALVVADDAGNTGYDTITVSVVDLMDPVAVAGDDVTVDQGQTVDFDGSHSSDNVGIVRYTWTFTYEDAEKSISDPIMSFEFSVPGVYAMTLSVEDMGGNVDTDTMVVTVLDIEPPIANAGEDVVVDQHTLVVFDGSGSTDNVAVVNYKWTFEYDGEQRGLDGTAPEFTFHTAGVYLVTLGILDAAVINYGEDTVTVTVLDIEPPMAVAGNDTIVDMSDTVTFDASASKDNVGVSSWTWTFTYGDADRTLEGEVVTFTFDRVGEFIVTLTVADARGNTAEDALTLVVKAPDGPDGDGFSVAMVGAIVAAVVVAVLVVVGQVMRRRHG